MAEYVDFTLTFTDNSSGARGESGTEVQIYSDSPSYKPTVKTDYAAARHAWMALPLINAGVTTLPIRLKAPVTFIKVRVRQFNANGFGDWNFPGGASGVQFDFTTGGQIVNTPNAPTNIGLVVAGTPTPPVDPPVDPPVIPDPPGSGGSSSNYDLQTQFSSTQGQNQWSYLDANGTPMTFYAAGGYWIGGQGYQGIWNGGFHPGSSIGAMLRWTAPSNGVVIGTGTVQLGSRVGNTGVTLTIKHNNSTVHTQTMTDTAVYSWDAGDVTVSVVAGDTINFILTAIGVITNCSTSIAPILQLTTDGSTPALPVLSSLTPTVVSLAPAGTAALTVALASRYSSAVSVTLSSDATGVATIPATVVIPAGQLSAVVTVTAVAVGGATITATYNGVAKTCGITVAAVQSGATWPNQPGGLTPFLNHNFSVVAGTNMLDVYNSALIVQDASAPISPPNVMKSVLPAGATFGGSQVEWNPGVQYKSIFMGLSFRTNPDYIGWTLVANKMFFIRGPVTNGFFGAALVGAGSFSILFGHNTGGLDNSHIWDADFGLVGHPNVSNPSITRGVWTTIEVYIRTSTTATSRDGIVRWWINRALCGDYTTVNYPGLLNQWIWTETYGGQNQILSVEKSYFLDHLYISGSPT